ncbi:MAG: hypothetical protein NWR72_06270 [Bacteroidia bacterium]|nr:hypothetical protein [Bacteroidia bacterium]
MKYSLLLLTALLFLSSCKETGIDPTTCRDGKCTYTFEGGKQVNLFGDSTNQYVEIINGDKLVFQYQYLKNEKANIADDEYTENIYFEIDPSVDAFSYSGKEELESINLIMQAICFCPVIIATPQSGSISGKKINDNTWEIDLNVTFDWDGSVVESEFSARFERE